MRSELRVEGMHCESCVRRVSLAVKKVPSAKIIGVKIGLVEVDVESEAERAAVIEAIRASGYDVEA